MKSATRKKLTIILGILVLLVIIAALLLPKLIDPNQYHGRIVSELENALGGTVRIGHITWGISGGVWIEVEDVSVAGSTAMPVDFKLPRFSCQRVDSSTSQEKDCPEQSAPGKA